MFTGITLPSLPYCLDIVSDISHHLYDSEIKTNFKSIGIIDLCALTIYMHFCQFSGNIDKDLKVYSNLYMIMFNMLLLYRRNF
jgi:hypothetical protein